MVPGTKERDANTGRTVCVCVCVCIHVYMVYLKHFLCYQVQKKEMPTLEELNEAFKNEKEEMESGNDMFAGINPFNMFK